MFRGDGSYPLSPNPNHSYGPGTLDWNDQFCVILKKLGKLEDKDVEFLTNEERKRQALDYSSNFEQANFIGETFITDLDDDEKSLLS